MKLSLGFITLMGGGEEMLTRDFHLHSAAGTHRLVSSCQGVWEIKPNSYSTAGLQHA